MFRSHKDVIDAWCREGETAAEGLRLFASDIRTTADHAKQMRRRDSIPSDYWPRVVSGAGSRDIDGVTLDLLAKLRSAKFERVKREPKAKRARPKTSVQRFAEA